MVLIRIHRLRQKRRKIKMILTKTLKVQRRTVNQRGSKKSKNMNFRMLLFCFFTLIAGLGWQQSQLARPRSLKILSFWRLGYLRSSWCWTHTCQLRGNSPRYLIWWTSYSTAFLSSSAWWRLFLEGSLSGPMPTWRIVGASWISSLWSLLWLICPWGLIWAFWSCSEPSALWELFPEILIWRLLFLHLPSQCAEYSMWLSSYCAFSSCLEFSESIFFKANSTIVIPHPS